MKVVFLKLKTLIALIVVGVVTAVLCIGITHAKQASSALKNGFRIVIDAGHGGIDGGVVGMDGKTKESTLNLYISKILANELSRKGYTVTLTRKTDGGLYSVGASNKKLSDMQKRKQIINETAPSLVISVHQNYYPSSSVKGAQVFYSDKQEKSKEYAELMQSSLNEFLSQNKQAKPADYYILQCSPYPSMLIECGFVSNASDLKNLLTPSYRESFSREIARVVDKILLKAQ